MNNKKYLILLPMIIIVSSFTSGLLGPGESFFEDFTSPSNDLNTSNWIYVQTNAPNGPYTISGGEAYFIGGPVNAGSARLILHNSDFNVNAKNNDFSVEMKVHGGGGTTKLYWLQKNFYISDDNHSWSGYTAYLGSLFYGGGGSSDRTTTYEIINGTSGNAASYSSYLFPQVATVYWTYKFIKTDTNIEYIINNISYYNQTLNSVWNEDNDAIQDNMTFFNIHTTQHNYVPYYIDFINITNLDAESNSIDLNYPANTTHYNDYNGSIIIDTVNIIDCDINDSNWDYHSNTADLWMWNRTITPDGDYNIRINCSSDGGEIIKHLNFVVDTVNPVIDVYSPLNNSQHEYMELVLINITYNDDNLFRTNTTIYNSTGGIMYNNYSGDLTGTSYNVTHYLNLSIGNYTHKDVTTDDHTVSNFNEILNYTIIPGDKNTATIYHLSNGDIEFKYPNDINLSTVTSTDRWRQLYTYEESTLDEVEIEIEADSIIYRDESGYACHLIINDIYWYDCEGLNVSEMEIDENKVVMKFFRNEDNDLSESIGGLNIVTEYYNFEMVSNVDLEIWDSNDGAMPYGDQYIHTDGQISFFANYTDHNNAPIESATCQIYFNDTGWNNMVWNSSINMYDYTRNINVSGTYIWNVTCNKSGYSSAIDSTDVIILSIPIMESAIILPIIAFTNDTLLGYCNASDEEGHNVTYSYKWYVNDVLNETGTTLEYYENIEINVDNISSVDTSINDEWILSCLATDDFRNTIWLNSSVLTILKSPPIINTTRINPDIPYHLHNLEGYCDVTNSTGDNIDYYYAWLKKEIGEINYTVFSEGVLLNQTGGVELLINTLSSDNTSKNDNWIFSCLGSDGIDNSSWLNSTAVLIANSTLNDNILRYWNFQNTLTDLVADDTMIAKNYGASLNYILNGALNNTIEDGNTDVQGGLMNAYGSGSQSFTYNLWVYPTVNLTGSSEFIYARDRENYIILYMVQVGGGSTTHRITVGGRNAFYDFENFNTDWHMYTVVVNANDETIIYKDGKEAQRFDHLDVEGTCGNCLWTMMDYWALNRPAYNYIDEFAVWNKALSYAEVVELYNRDGNITIDQAFPFYTVDNVISTELIYPLNQIEYNYDDVSYDISNLYNGSVILETSDTSSCTLNDSRWILNSSNGIIHHFIFNETFEYINQNISIDFNCEGSFNNDTILLALNYNIAPTIYTLVTPDIVYALTDVDAYCNSSDLGNLTFNYAWYINNTIFSNDTIEIASNPFEINSTLQYENITQSDNITFICTVTDTDGLFISSQASVTVYDMPEPTFIETTQASYQYLSDTIAKIKINESQWNYSGPTEFNIDYYDGGWIDIVEFNATVPEFSWIRNSSKEFTSISAYRITAQDSADFNGDGLLDIVMTEGGADYKFFIYYNNGTYINPNYVKSVTVSIPIQFRETDLAVTDFDNDGDTDILFVPAGTNNFIYAYQNVGNSTSPAFLHNSSCSPNYASFQHQDGKIGTGDINGDGIYDILVSKGTYISGSVGLGFNVYLSDGDCTYTSRSDLASQIYDNLPFGEEKGIASPTLYDFDHDGDLDVYVITGRTFFYNYDSSVSFLNIGDNENPEFIVSSVEWISGFNNAAYQIEVDDIYPNDNYPEFMLTSDDSSTYFRIYENTYDNTADEFWSTYNWNISTLVPGTYDIRGSASYFETTSDFTIGNITISNPIFNVTHIAPIDNLVTQNPLNISAVVDMDAQHDVNCSLYVNDILNSTQTSITDEVNINFLPDLTVGIHTYYVNCTDGYTSAVTVTQNILFDNEGPVIQSNIPTIFNNTIYSGYNMTFRGNVTNLNLSLVNITIYRPNSSIYYNNETISFTNITFFDWEWIFNTTPTDNGIWSMNIYSIDHLANTNEKEITFTVINCVPDWTCDSFNVCDGTSKECTSMIDDNSCGLSFTGTIADYDETCSIADGGVSGGGCPTGTIEFNSVCVTDSLMTNIIYEDAKTTFCTDRRSFFKLGILDTNDEYKEITNVTMEIEGLKYTLKYVGDTYIFDDILTVPENLANTTVKFTAIDTINGHSYSISSTIQLSRGDCGIDVDLLSGYVRNEISGVTELIAQWKDLTDTERVQAVKDNYFTLLFAVFAAIWLVGTVVKAFNEGGEEYVKTKN